ncbi:hypothetical protein DL762_004291 [Monosporascus cannonballus]|uniref:Amine oxidase domain-containing protein n=1 Tax=Monosporascus cannonballus TaxID=155416 RepID=A0ABY0HB74_9PEZI|nr:hypothetical protein DL762_004291 [Monosporascus cannonballus]
MKREVAILGGGSSGMYTAHPETYTDPVIWQRDYVGVLNFHDIPVVRDYFAHFDIPLRVLRMSPARSSPALLEGFDKLAVPVPEDLLLLFRQFAEKYGIQDVVPMLALYGRGGGRLRENHDSVHCQSIWAQRLWRVQPSATDGRPARQPWQELYEAAYDALGSDNVLLSSTVSAAKRSEKGVHLKFVRADGSRVDIQAEKLVVAIAPTLDKLSALGLDGTEAGPFERFTNVPYFTGIIRESGLRADTAVFPYGSGLHETSAEEAKAAIIEDLTALTTAINSTSAEPATFKAHTPFQSTVSKEDIADGF